MLGISAKHWHIALEHSRQSENINFHNVTKKNGNISLQSFNVHRTLKWGRKILLLDKIVELPKKPRANTTAILNSIKAGRYRFAYIRLVDYKILFS